LSRRGAAQARRRTERHRRPSGQRRPLSRAASSATLMPSTMMSALAACATPPPPHARAQNTHSSRHQRHSDVIEGGTSRLPAGLSPAALLILMSRPPPFTSSAAPRLSTRFLRRHRPDMFRGDMIVLSQSCYDIGLPANSLPVLSAPIYIASRRYLISSMFSCATFNEGLGRHHGNR